MKAILTSLTLLGSFCLQAQLLESEMDRTMQEPIDAGKLHGCVVYVQKGDQVLLHKAYGYQDVERKKVMKTDAIFNIASMAKTITAAGAMKLYQQRKFLMDDPVEKYLPELAELKVLEYSGTDSARLVAPKRSITIRDLLRHTAGFSYCWRLDEAKDRIDSLYVTNGMHLSKTPEEFLKKLASIPLKYHPGSKWEYSYSIDVLGFLIERISGMNLHDYLKEALFDPLGMTATGFYLENKDDYERLSNLYRFENQKLEKVKNFRDQYVALPTLRAAGGGLGLSIDGALLSSTSDFATFCNMLLNYGEHNGKQILAAASVELMITNQIAGVSEKSFPIDGYGLGVGVYAKPEHGKTVAIDWTGAFNTIFLVNYEKDLVGIFMTQHDPWSYMDIMWKFLGVLEDTVR